jgi:hypothetical protein
MVPLRAIRPPAAREQGLKKRQSRFGPVPRMLLDFKGSEIDAGDPSSGSYGAQHP